MQAWHGELAAYLQVSMFVTPNGKISVSVLRTRVGVIPSCRWGYGKTQGLQLQTDGVHAITGLPAADRHYAVF